MSTKYQKNQETIWRSRDQPKRRFDLNEALGCTAEENPGLKKFIAIERENLGEALGRTVGEI